MKTQKGFGILECLVSILLLTFVMVGGMSFYFYSNQYLQGSINKRIAAEIANSNLEEIKKDGYAGLPDTDGIWVARTADENIKGLVGHKKIYVDQIDKDSDGITDYKHVWIEIDWHEPEKPIQQKIRLDTHISP